MRLQEIRDEIKTLTTEAYNLKTKKAKQKRWVSVRELRSEARDILYTLAEKCEPETIKVTVLRDYNAGDYSDYFFVKSETYGTLHLSPTGDILSKSWYTHTCCIEYKKGDELSLEVRTEVNTDTLYLNIVPMKHSGGTVNKDYYKELCKNKNLAFFKYPENEGVTGLFAK